MIHKAKVVYKTQGSTAKLVALWGCTVAQRSATNIHDNGALSEMLMSAR